MINRLAAWAPPPDPAVGAYSDFLDFVAGGWRRCAKMDERIDVLTRLKTLSSEKARHPLNSTRRRRFDAVFVK